MDTYEKKYKKALERANEYHFDGAKQCIIDTLEYIFPELKDSEDERIRKWLITQLELKSDVNNPHDLELMILKSIAWLEKQGESVEINPTEFDTRLQALIGKFDSLPKEELIGSLSFWMNVVQNDGTYKDEEKQGEQKVSYTTLAETGNGGINALVKKELPTNGCDDEQNLADKIEPKFKVGDWINGYYTNYKVLSINNEGYVVEDVDGNKINILFENEKFHHLWTIQDAKDGDMLSDGTTIFIFKDLLSDDSVMSYCDYETDSGESDAFCPLSVNLMCSKITPATKEQRDTLMKAMSDAGWEFDFEKKELKKISQRMISAEAKEAMYGTKPSDEEMKELLRTEHEKGRADAIAEGHWSDEDEEMCQETIDWFEKKCFPYALESENPARESIKWLKSLKERL